MVRDADVQVGALPGRVDELLLGGDRRLDAGPAALEGRQARQQPARGDGRRGRVNPKAWGLTATATAAVGGRGWAEFAALARLLAACSASGLALRSAAGPLLERLRDDAKRRFDLVCGSVLVACAATLAAQAFP